MAGLAGATNSRVCIYRIVKNQPPSYVAECDPASFSLDDLRDKYRGGEFRLYIMKEGKLWKNMRVSVEPPPHNDAPTAVSSGMADVLAVMRDGFQAQAAAMRELATAPRAASPFAGMDVPAVITAVAAAITALRPPPAPPAPPPPPDRSVDMLIQGIQLASELREGAAPADNSIGGMLRTFLQSPLVAQAVQAAASPPAPPVSHAKPALPAPTTPRVVSPAAPAEPAAQPTDQQTTMLHYYYGLLCQKAAEGADPTLYAEIVLDNVPDDTLNMLLSRQPTPLDALIAEYPPAAPHRAWFATLIDTMMQALTDEEEPEPAAPANVVQPAGAPANASDPQPPVVPGQPS
ncbi:MAG: hypothetical protein EKK55_21850 [Rhodocyclaceae bacterium]|nr:MAG: hypothetical protein EKK55_21850 [Rhodocyclaceae bacterium]